jgi:hypothetical protein
MQDTDGGRKKEEIDVYVLRLTDRKKKNKDTHTITKITNKKEKKIVTIECVFLFL